MNAVVETKQNQVAVVDQASSLIGMIERAAKDPNVDMDKMERLWVMYKEESARQAEAKFNSAFAQMQSDMPEIREGGKIIHKDKNTGQEKLISTYGRWDEDINPVLKPVLQKHGFALSFRIETTDKIRIEAVLAHEAGHSVRTSIVLPADTSGNKNPVQAVASSASYGKRYTAGALLNITTFGQDDDGNKAGEQPVITEQQAANIQALAEEVNADKARFLKHLSTQCKKEIKTISEIPASAQKLAVDLLESKRKKQ
jgi:hypothetical protein